MATLSIIDDFIVLMNLSTTPIQISLVKFVVETERWVVCSFEVYGWDLEVIY